MSDDRAKMLEGLAQDFQRLREGISALGAKADELDRLGDWLQQNLDEVPAIGPGPAAVAMAVIRKLKGRVAELEAVLRNVQYALFQEFEADGFETTYRERCVGCGRLSAERCKAGCSVCEALKGGQDATRRG